MTFGNLLGFGAFVFHSSSLGLMQSPCVNELLNLLSSTVGLFSLHHLNSHSPIFSYLFLFLICLSVFHWPVYSITCLRFTTASELFSLAHYFNIFSRPTEFQFAKNFISTLLTMIILTAA